MEYSSKRRKTSRIEGRALLEELKNREGTAQDNEKIVKEEQSRESGGEALSLREVKERTTMGFKHRLLHRRQAIDFPTTFPDLSIATSSNTDIPQPTVSPLGTSSFTGRTVFPSVSDATQITAIAPVTPDIVQATPTPPSISNNAQGTPSSPVISEVGQATIGPFVATDIFQATLLPTPDANPTFPLVEVVPTVPPVPPFPTDLLPPAVPQVSSVSFPVVPTVPPFPFPGTTLEPPSPSPSQVIFSSPPPTPTTPTTTDSDLSATGLVLSTPTRSIGNVTVQGFSALLSANTNLGPFTSDATNSAASSSVTGGFASFPAQASETSGSASTMSLTRTSSRTVTSSTQTTSKTGSSLTSSSTGVVVVVGGGPGNTGGEAPPVDAGESLRSNDGHATTPTPVVVGSVIGSLAGFAALLVLALLILRWYKRKRRRDMQPLPHGEGEVADHAAPGRSDTEMSERYFLPAAAAAFFGKYRGKETAPAPPQEPSFQRISGRKLPSVFSPGMSSNDPFDDKNAFASSPTRDSSGMYTAIPNTGNVPRAQYAATESETLMPSPARTPVVHSPGPHASFLGGRVENYTPPQTPARPPHLSGLPGTLGRSLPSQDGSRGSKFTEDV
ncbi:hypothetical protein M501DRAFT_999975 [Patellaria atrata CBS 101060]|uniref:Uncharacterized protein n=1 Tax=Patellaria atrata CBS 101060 TaxID=1346257 RepID=A0A9P4VJ30_9PEZI|nr:hypothetical protein M501DRAFT_999975 [Patellaria atrata CBS 101060]